MSIINREEIKNFLATEHLIPKEELLTEGELDRLTKLLKNNNSVLIAHYYTSSALQQLAEYSGGFIGDSLEMAKFGVSAEAKNIIVAGVRFMGETAKILSPEKKILMIENDAMCSLDILCPEDEFAEFIKKYPDHKVVVYANTSANVKALADWVVTSSIALKVVEHLHSQGEKIVFAPDKHLGAYINKQTGADMILWDASCVVHEEFNEYKLKTLKSSYDDAIIVAHPESRMEVLNLADFVGSTTGILNFVKNSDKQNIIIATEAGIFYKIRQTTKDKNLILAPSGNESATCRACGHCPWMNMNSLSKLEKILTNTEHQDEITLPSETIAKAKISLGRMMEF